MGEHSKGVPFQAKGCGRKFVKKDPAKTIRKSDAEARLIVIGEALERGKKRTWEDCFELQDMQRSFLSQQTETLSRMLVPVDVRSIKESC